jgi:beta-hydroxylase
MTDNKYMMKQPYHDTSLYPFVKVFEDNWDIINREFLRVQQHMVAYTDAHLYNQGWEVFGLWGFRHHDRNEPMIDSELKLNTKFCPRTADLVRKHVPVNGSVGFSRLAAGTVIQPHTGDDFGFLRMHLGIQVPEGDIGLRVQGEDIKWQTGRAFIFDDSLLHEAWNRTDQDRVVLILDFYP